MKNFLGGLDKSNDIFVNPEWSGIGDDKNMSNFY